MTHRATEHVRRSVHRGFCSDQSPDYRPDGQPIDLGSISLVPAGKDGSDGRASGGVITDGKYSIPEENGPAAGKYRVEIHWLKLTGKRLLDKDTGEMYDQRLEALPPKFHSQSELTIDVPTPNGSHDFTLKSS